MKPDIRKSLRLMLLAIALVFAAVLLGILPFRADFLKVPIQEAVRDAAGLALTVEGPVKVRLGPTPGVTSGGISLGAPDAEPLLEVDSVHARISLFSLLRGRIHVREISSNGVYADYCAPLPDFPEKTAEEFSPPTIIVAGVEIRGISIRCGAATQHDPLAINVSRLQAFAPLGASVQLSAEGSVSAREFELFVTGGELNELLTGNAPFPVNGKLASSNALLEISGHIQVTAGEPIADAQYQAGVRDLRSLAGALHIDLPNLGELDARGNLRVDRKTIDLSGLTGTLGNSDFAVDASVNFAEERPRITLAVASDRFDIEPLLVSESVARVPAPVAADADVDLGAALDALKLFDAHFDVTVNEVLGLPLDVTSIRLVAATLDGQVELETLTAEVLGGSASLTGKLNSRIECPEFELEARASELDLAALNPLLELEQPLGGGAHAVSLNATSCGSSLFAHRDALRAHAEFAKVQISLGGEILPLTVSNSTISIEPGERGHGRLTGTFMGERINAALAVGSLEALLGTDTWPLDVDVRGAGSRLQANGRSRLVPGQLLVETRVRLNAPTVGTLHAWTGLAADAGLPLSGETRLRVDASEIVADNIAITLGNSDMGGRVAWRYAEQSDLLAVTVRSNTVDIAEILTVLPPAPEHADSAAVQEADDETARAVVLPPVNLDLQIGAIHADRLDIQNLSIAGRLRKGLIDEARVSLIVEDEVRLDGSLDLDARRLPARGQLGFSAKELNIGRVLRRMGLVDDLHMRADALELLVDMQGATPRQFVLNTLLQADLLGFNWKIPRSNTGEVAGAEDGFEVELAQVQLTTAPDQPTKWSSRGRVDGVDAELFMRAPSLNDVFSDMAELPITLVAAAGDNVAMIDVGFDRATQDKLNAHVMFSGQIIDRNNRALSELASPLEDYQLQSDVILNQNHMQFADVRMRLGSSSAEGRFDVDATGSRTRFDIAFHAPHFQTDDLLYWSRVFGDSAANEGERSEEDPDPYPNNGDAIDEPGETRGVLYLFNDFLAEFREDNDLDVSITVDELRSGSGYLGGGEIHLHVDEDDFRLSPLTFSLPGGGVDAEYWATTIDGRLDAGLRINADALSYGGLLRLADPESEARGLLFLDTQISANTELMPDSVPLNLLFQNAGGSISFAAWPQNFEAGILDLWSANVVLAVLPKPEGGEPSRLNCLVTRFDVEDGLMKSRTTLLDTTTTVIRGRGTINLKAKELDLRVWPQAKREKFFSVSAPVSVTGSFEEFQIGVEPGGFVGTLTKWYTALIYVPFKWLTGERFAPDGTSTCFDAMDWELTPELQEYFLQRDFSAPPAVE